MEFVLLILGNQLFPIKHYKKLKIDKVFMAEDHGLCTHYKYHKHKIIFFLSSMRRYSEELKASEFKVSYYDSEHQLFEASYEEKLVDFLKNNKKVKKVVCYTIEDQFFENRIIKFFKEKGIEIEFLPSPMFLTTRKNFQEYLKTQKRPFMKTFYQLQRKRLGLLLDKYGKPEGGRWSFDLENRKKIPKDLVPPELPKIKNNSIVEAVIEVVNKKFSDHPGVSSEFWLPTSRRESLIWLKNFITHRLLNFGAYQDAITDQSDFVFHSVVSPMVNIGFLIPDEICEKVISAYRADPKNIPMNSVEGFIRQVIGWREFVRGIYQEYAKVQWETNFWGHKKKLKPCWYNGTTGIPVLDDAIKKANRFGYNHHIERLMIISNMMLLSEVHPHQVYAWFMEMSVDSSDWVMGPNVFGMGQFSDGGIFATKPYICGSNYYLKMSRYKKGDWCHAVDGLYWRFIEKHKDFYKKNPRMAVMTKNLERMDPDRKKTIFSAADEFILKSTVG